MAASLDQFIHRMKPYCTRKNGEIASLILILLCASTLFWNQLGVQKTLHYDGGNIVYSGTVKANKLTGQGSIRFKNGDHYQGQVKNGQFHGHGTFTSKDGWTYTGDFKQGRPEGQGKLTTKNKTVYQGTFKQGIYQHED